MTSQPKGKLKVPARACSECKETKPVHRTQAGMVELRDVEVPPVTLSDSLGKQHTFYFDVRLTTGLGIRAYELIDGSPGGYLFCIMEHPEFPVKEAYLKLLERIKEGLSVHYLQSSDFGPFHNRLYMKGDAINGRIEESAENLSRPVVVIDGREYSWEELGQFVSSHMGFNFRLEIFDPYDDSIEVTPNPEREDRLWWLPKSEIDEENSGNGRNYQ
jgi:hypothetical protein